MKVIQQTLSTAAKWLMPLFLSLSSDAHQLIKMAAKEGVPEAQEVLEKVCSRGHCDEWLGN